MSLGNKPEAATKLFYLFHAQYQQLCTGWELTKEKALKVADFTDYRFLSDL